MNRDASVSHNAIVDACFKVQLNHRSHKGTGNWNPTQRALSAEANESIGPAAKQASATANNRSGLRELKNPVNSGAFPTKSSLKTAK